MRHPPRLLHSNFVVAVLSDLFGIQARSGCFCAGPYLHRLYRSTTTGRTRMNAECERGHLGAKLAFLRLGFNYFISEAVFQYVLGAVHLLADHGWKLLPLYRFDPDSGMWRHRDRPPAPTLGRPRPARHRSSGPILARHLAEARLIVRAVEAVPPGESLPDPPLSPEFERIRWFPLPGEAVAQLRQPMKGTR